MQKVNKHGSVMLSTIRNNQIEKKKLFKTKMRAYLDLQPQTTHANGRGFKESEHGLKISREHLIL